MPRVKKADAVAAAAAAPVAPAIDHNLPAELDHAAPANVEIDIAAFLNLRDSIVQGLAAMQDVVHKMSSTYVTSTNAMLLESGFDERYLVSTAVRAPVPEATAGDDKKEKKKRVHDPNAPKRPLTPFFLYMQTARPIIAADLGPEQPKKAVGVEGVRRWKEMADSDKQLWTNAYTDNLKLYNARVHAYKAGNMNAKDMDDIEAARYAEVNNIAVLPGDELDLGADAQLTAEHLGELPGHIDTPTSPEASPEPAKTAAATPKAKAARAKKGKQTPVATPQTTETPVVPIVPSSAQKAPSPDKKRKRGSKKSDEIVASIEAPAEETPKNKSGGRKKKTRGE